MPYWQLYLRTHKTLLSLLALVLSLLALVSSRPNTAEVLRLTFWTMTRPAHFHQVLYSMAFARPATKFGWIFRPGGAERGPEEAGEGMSLFRRPLSSRNEQIEWLTHCKDDEHSDTEHSLS